MQRIIYIEWLKIKNYNVFWWMISITIVSYLLINFLISTIYNQMSFSSTLNNNMIKSIIENPFDINEVWHTIAYLSSLLIFLPALIIIMLITNETTYKTHRQNIINGWSRNDFLMGKFLIITCLSLGITLLYVTICLIIGYLNTNINTAFDMNKLAFILYFFVQTISQLSLAFFLGYFIKKTYLSLAIFFFTSIIIEPILSKIINTNRFDISRFLPFEMTDLLIPPPSAFTKLAPDSIQNTIDNLPIQCLISIFALIIYWYISLQINKKIDL